MEKLKPCPFCGGKAEARDGLYTQMITISDSVECTVCGVAIYKESFIEAIEAWNTRTKK